MNKTLKKSCVFLTERTFGVTFVCFFGIIVWAHAAPIMFDDLPNPGTNTLAVPVGYNGLNWVSFRYMDPVQRYDSHPNGYQAGMVSPNYVAYDSGGSSASITNAASFNFLSADLTAAWNDNLQLEVLGYAGTTLVYNDTYTLSATVPTLINFDYLGVNNVYFSPSGGTHHTGYDGTGEQFVMDNLTISVPEPSSEALVMIGSALLLCHYVRQRSFSKK